MCSANLPMQSLKSRLGVGLVLSLFVIFTLQWLVVIASMRRVAENYVLGRLGHDVDNLLVGLSFDVDGKPYLDPTRVDLVYQQPFSGHYFRISTRNKVIRARSLWDQDLPPLNLPSGATESMREPGPQGQALLVLARGFLKQGHSVTIAVAEEVNPIEVDIRKLQLYYALISIAVMLLLLASQTLIVRYALAPLDRMRRDIVRLERGEISQLEGDAPEEVRPLVFELNRMLALMIQRLQRSRQSLGNLAHALKTPLTLLNDLARQEKLGALPEIREQIASQSNVINRLIERELQRARLAGAATSGQLFDAAREIPPLVQTLKSLYRHKALAIDYRIPDRAEIAADREDMLELIGNLADNACKWAQGHVLIAIESGAGLEMHIHDDGPGCPPEELEHLSQRGTRLDESTAGHGLGLAIAHDIVQSYGGSLGFGRSEILGGFRVDVSLPAPHAAES